jgi:hypothetical protein
MEPATSIRWKCFLFLSMRLGRAIQFQSQSCDDELVQANPTIQNYLASLLQQAFIERDAWHHDDGWDHHEVKGRRPLFVLPIPITDYL